MTFLIFLSGISCPIIEHLRPPVHNIAKCLKTGKICPKSQDLKTNSLLVAVPPWLGNARARFPLCRFPSQTLNCRNPFFSSPKLRDCTKTGDGEFSLTGTGNEWERREGITGNEKKAWRCGEFRGKLIWNFVLLCFSSHGRLI